MSTLVNESGSTVARRTFAPRGGGLFPFLIADQEFNDDDDTSFGTVTLVVSETARIEFPRDMLGDVHVMIEEASRWYWENYPPVEGAPMQAPPKPEPRTGETPQPGVPVPVPMPIYQPSYQRPGDPPIQAQAAPQQRNDDESWWEYRRGSGPTAKQLVFITGLAKKLGWSAKDADDAAAEGYGGRTVDQLDTKMASGFIDWLKGQAAQARHGAPAGDPPPR